MQSLSLTRIAAIGRRGDQPHQEAHGRQVGYLLSSTLGNNIINLVLVREFCASMEVRTQRGLNSSEYTGFQVRYYHLFIWPLIHSIKTLKIRSKEEVKDSWYIFLPVGSVLWA